MIPLVISCRKSRKAGLLAGGCAVAGCGVIADILVLLLSVRFTRISGGPGLVSGRLTFAEAWLGLLFFEARSGQRLAANRIE